MFHASTVGYNSGNPYDQYSNETELNEEPSSTGCRGVMEYCAGANGSRDRLHLIRLWVKKQPIVYWIHKISSRNLM